MSTHNVCFHREIRKILCGYPLLHVSVAMYFMINLHEIDHEIFSMVILSL